MKQEIFFYYFPDELRHEQQRILHPATLHDPLEKFPTLLNIENVEIVLSSILNLRIL